MAKMQRQIIPVGDGAKFTVTRTNTETGKVTDSNTFESEKPIKAEQLGVALSQEVKSQGSRRTMWQSLLGFIMANPKLDGYKGNADKATGKLPDGYKASVRTCEEEFLRDLVKHGHVKLHVGKDDNAEKVFQSFATSIREDKNYSNVKSTVLRYYAIVGSHPVTPSGYLVPVPVMTEAIAQVLDANKLPEEKGYYVKLLALLDEFNKDKGPDLADLGKCVPVLKQFLGTVEGILTHEAELATAALHGIKTGDVKDTADKALASAQETLKSVGKGKAVVKKAETETAE